MLQEAEMAGQLTGCESHICVVICDGPIIQAIFKDKRQARALCFRGGKV